MARRKRMVLEERGKGKKRPAPPPRPDQILMSRRVFLSRGLILSAFGLLAGKLGWMQVVQRQIYAAQAESNQQQRVRLKAPRGLIYDRAGRLLADNRRSWQVRLTPADLPDDPDQRRAVLDQLISVLALPDVLVLDPNDVPKGKEELVYSGVVKWLSALDMLGTSSEDQWLTYLRTEAARQYLVLIWDDLTADQAAQFRAGHTQLPGVKVINRIDFLVGNLDDPRQPVIVKEDVPREIALRLEANKLYLPGVELDDSVLKRRYLGGPVMSHVLGYARTVRAQDLDPKTNVDPATGEAIYEYDDINGQDGLEASMESLLRGTKGRVLWIVDSHNVRQRIFPGSEVPPVPGKNLKLTIDLEFQSAVSRILADAIDFANKDRTAKNKVFKVPAKAGSVVAIDPRTGEVLCLVSYPHYDNQLFVDGISAQKWQEYTADTGAKPYLNRAIAGRYPSGSTIKPFHALGGLKEGTLTTKKTYLCTGGIMVPLDIDETKGQQYPCWTRLTGGHGTLDVYGAIEQSCDVFFYNVGTPHSKIEGANDYLRYRDMNYTTNQIGKDVHYFEGLGKDRMNKNLRERFWFGTKTGIDLPDEFDGVVPDQQYLDDVVWAAQRQADPKAPRPFWSAGDTINVSIGQGYFQTTPLQLALNIAAIANGGTIYKPLLVKEIVDSNGATVQQSKPQVLRKIDIPKEHFDVVREGMRRVVNGDNGSANFVVDTNTGRRITKWPNTNPPDQPDDQKITIGGKTGTAEIGQQLPDGTYDRQHAWFVCFAPWEAPEIAVAVIIEDGGEGSSYAVPVADKVLRAYFELTGTA